MPHVLGLEERLEGLGLVQLAQDAQLLAAIRLTVWKFNMILDPASLVGILDMHVFDADGPRIGISQDPEDLT